VSTIHTTLNRNSTISAVVTRANGAVEDLGVVSYKDSNPFKTFGWYLTHPEQWRHKLVSKPFTRIKRFFGA
jgi:hypothetical protein